MFLLLALVAFGQNERKEIRQGIKAYVDGDFSEAEVEFRKAADISQESYEASFNTGAALYNQEKYEETVEQYQALLEQTSDPASEAQIWHNIGNSMLEGQQYGPAIEAYKNSLRRNPTDQDSKYNLAYAKQKLQEQEQQQQQNQDQDQDQDQQDKKDQKDQKDQKDKQDQNEQENKDQQDQSKQNQEDQQKQDQDQQATPMEISREDAERLLKAIQQQEKDVKEKVDKKKAAAAKVKTEKDW
jgi:Ca-activated chloride channel family protein